MGTTAEKLTYLNNTKQLLKENINSLGGNLTNEPFRQYASVLEDIYESLPKVSGIGASLSLSPSLMGKIKLNEIQGNTLQDGTPTPDTPVPIQSVTGLQNVEICGKNMFKTGTSYTPASVGWRDQFGNELNSANNLLSNSNYIDLIANKTYTFSVKEKTNISEAQCVYISSGNIALLNTISLTSDTTITPTQNTRIWIRSKNNATATTTLFNGQLEQGSTATTYEPYKGNTYEVNLGKNLINYNSTGSGKEIDFTFSGSELTLNGTTNGSGEITTTSAQPITLKPGTYTFSSTKTGSFTANSKSVAIYFKKVSDGTNIINLNNTNSYVLSSSFTLTEETKVYVQIYTNGAGFVFDNLKIQWQVEVGSKTSYSPYFTPIELNKIGDYKDSIKKSTGKNLLPNNWLSGTISASTGLPIGYGTRMYTQNPIKLNGNTTYCLKINNTSTYSLRLAVDEYDINHTHLGRIGGTNGSVNGDFTTQQNTAYINITVIDSNETATYSIYQDLLSSSKLCPMLNEGSTALPYEPYGKVWYVTENIGEVVLNGTESDSTYNTGTTGSFTRFGYLPFMNTDVCKIQSDYVSNYFKYLGTIGGDTTEAGISNTSVSGLNRLFIFLPTSTASTIAQFKTWLSTHNTEIKYIKATPTYKVITNTELIEQLESLYNAKSEDGTTNINVTSENLAMILNVGVLKGE